MIELRCENSHLSATPTREMEMDTIVDHSQQQSAQVRQNKKLDIASAASGRNSGQKKQQEGANVVGGGLQFVAHAAGSKSINRSGRHSLNSADGYSSTAGGATRSESLRFCLTNLPLIRRLSSFMISQRKREQERELVPGHHQMARTMSTEEISARQEAAAQAAAEAAFV